MISGCSDELVRYMVHTAGFNPCHTDHEFRTPIMYASFFGVLRLVKLLSDVDPHTCIEPLEESRKQPSAEESEESKKPKKKQQSDVSDVHGRTVLHW